MAGIGDSWGTAQELLHPRDSHGRFRSKWKMSESVFNAVEKVLSTFRPHTFQSDGQARQYTKNLADRKPGRFQGGRGYSRLQADFMHANEDLLDGNPDEPSTKRFVAMMDEAMEPIPEDIIASSVVPPSAFGLTPDRLPELEEMTGNVIANRGYQATTIGTPIGGGNGNITMIQAVPKGTKMAIPGRNVNDPEMFFDRDQEFTVSKVKPDGRGGYNMWVVATPKTPDDNPPPIGGQAGPGKPADREAAVTALENAGMQRLMGQQGESQLPGGQAAGGLPENPNGTVQTPEQQRAASRAQVLGRGAPATGNEPAPPPAAPTPAPAAEPNPNAPAAPTPAPAVPAAPTPAPAEAPAAPTPSGVEPPNGATSVVTGEAPTSFREAVQSANLESPSAGPRRREWNSAYMGVTSGKMHPADALRELESDIAKNKHDQTGPVGEADSQLGSDIEKQEKLADLIQSHFNLGEPKQRSARKEVESDLAAKRTARAKAKITRPGGGTDKREDGRTAAEAARPGPLAKVAPKRAGTAEERGKELGANAEKDREDDRLNAEQRAQWSEEVGPEPKGLTHGDILLDEMADQLRNGRITRAKAAARIRDSIKGDDDAQAKYLEKIASAIESDTSKPAKRVPLKKAAPKAAPDTEKVEAALTGRTDKNILTGLNAHSVGDLRALADKWGIETRGEDKKLKLKSALAKELAAKWKATPSLQRKAEVPEGTPAADELDSMTVAQLKDYAKAHGIKVTGALRKDAMKAAIKKQRDNGKAPEAEAPTVAAPVEDKVRFPGRLSGLPGARPRKEPTPEEALARAQKTINRLGGGEGTVPKGTPLPAATAADDEALARAKKTVAGLGTPKTPEAKKLAKVAATPDMPAPIAKAAVKAAKAADAPAAPRVAPKKKLAPGQLTNDELAEASRRVLAGEDPGDVGNEITGRRGESPLGAPELPEKIKTPDEVRADLRRIGDTGTLEDGKKYLDDQKLSAKDMRLLAEGLGVPVGSKDTKVKIRDNIANTIVGGRVTDRAMGRGLNPPTPGGPETPAEPKIPGIDTAERERLQKAAKEVIADMQAEGTWGRADPFPKLTEKLSGEPSTPTEMQQILEQTHGPTGMALGDRIAVRLMQRMDSKMRDTILGEMSESERKKLLDDAERMGVEDLRVRKSGHDLDRILKDAGLSQGSSQENAAVYHEVKLALANGDVPRAQGALKKALDRVDVRLDQARQQAGNESLPTSVRERSGRDITHYLGESEWLRSVAGALHQGDSPELVTKSEAKDVIPLHTDPKSPLAKATAADLRRTAADAGIKLPEGATTRDEVVTELARELIRRDKAGKKLPELTVPAAVPVKVPGKKAVSTGTPELVDRLNSQTSREDAAAALEGVPTTQLREVARQLSIPRQSSMKVADLRREIVDATAGRTIDSEATRGFKGPIDQTPLGNIGQTLSRAAKSTPPAKKAAPAGDNVTEARAKKREADDRFREIQDRLARVGGEPDEEHRNGPENDSDNDTAQLEDDLETARDEREAAAEDLRAAQAAAKKATPAKAAKKAAAQAAADDQMKRNMAVLTRGGHRETPTSTKEEVKAEVAKATAPVAAKKATLSVKEEVKAEVAKATAAPVKAAKKAAPSGQKQYTEEELQDMNLTQIKGIEDDRGLMRPSVAKGDRIKHILANQGAPVPAPTKPAKKVTPVQSAAEIKAVEAKPVSTAAPTKVGSGKITAGKYSIKPQIANRWGEGGGEIHYHTHGAVGRAVENMGNDRALDVDGDRLDNVLGRIATDTVTGATGQKEQLEQLKKLRDRLPEGSKARNELGTAINELAGKPTVALTIPKNTPAPLTELARQLGDIPLASGSRIREGSDLENLQKVINDWHAGELSPLGLETAIRRMWGFNHESQEGRLQVDRAIVAAEAAIKELRTKKLLVRPTKEE